MIVGRMQGRVMCSSFFPFGRAVHRRRLIQRGVDAGERGQIDDRAVARCLPDIRKHIHRLKVFRLGHEMDGIPMNIWMIWLNRPLLGDSIALMRLTTTTAEMKCGI